MGGATDGRRVRSSDSTANTCSSATVPAPKPPPAPGAALARASAARFLRPMFTSGRTPLAPPRGSSRIRAAGAPRAASRARASGFGSGAKTDASSRGSAARRTAFLAWDMGCRAEVQRVKQLAAAHSLVRYGMRRENDGGGGGAGLRCRATADAGAEP